MIYKVRNPFHTSCSNNKKEKANAQKNTLLKNAQANATSNFFKRVFFSPTQEEFFPTLFFKKFISPPTGRHQICTDRAINVNRFYLPSCRHESESLRMKSRAADNKKINANFLFGGFIASYESLWVNEQLCFVSTVVRKLPQIKNFVYPLCVIANAKTDKQPHILAHLFAPSHWRPLRKQKS